MARMPRASKGHQKIKMVKMKNEANLAVTFSKRRFTAYKSASELCTLTGAEIALIVFSPGCRPFSFGSPDVHSIIDRYLNNGLQPNGDPMGQLQHMIVSENLNEEVMHLEKMLEEEKKRAQTMDSRIHEHQGRYWWDVPSEMLNLQQLEELKMSLQNLHMTTLSIKLQAQAPIQDLLGYYKPTTNFGVPRYGTRPLNLNVGISLGGASPSNMPQSIQMDNLGLPPTNFGVSHQYSDDPSTIQGDVFINGIALSNQMAISTMAASSSSQTTISTIGTSTSNQMAGQFHHEAK